MGSDEDQITTVGRLTSLFGLRHSPFEEEAGEYHHGIDIANALGTPVRATADGVVQIASWQGGYGRLVVLDHGRGFRTYYGHNSKLLVKVGDHVTRNQVISYMGTSGHSTGYHYMMTGYKASFADGQGGGAPVNHLFPSLGSIVLNSGTFTVSAAYRSK